MEVEKQAEKLEPYAMEWLLTKNDFSNDDMDKFLEGLPGYISSRHTKKDGLDDYLNANYILRRIKEHLITCATSVELSNEASIARVSFCVQAIWRIFKDYRERNKDTPLPRKYIQELIDEFQTLCKMGDPTIALRASCTRALAVPGLLSQLVSSTSDSEEPSRFPEPFKTFHNFFFPNDNVDLTQADEIKRMWKNLLHDVPFANMTIFI